ncbi:protein FAR1-RELATED SEQUENCE 5-like [Apium graveolens]|uniref:protein FAR1-RELATED SEQUENCE 5-like n=1 Tax=Apium graveolens TaxID=4045 RepID=UPI003D7B6D17
MDLEHNHKLVSPEKVQFFQRSLNIDPMTRSLIELFNKSGIETGKVMKFLSETKGGVENLGFSNQDVRNVIRDIRRRVFDSGDAECGLLLLRELQENIFGNFFYRVDVDDENRVRGLVWVDPRSMNAYKNFGDVVTFDSTYRTNRDETEASYKWVLRTWLEAVDNKPPRTIITDQDITLGNAIAEVMPMPQINHTYCTWHISSKFPEKLSYLYTNYPEFKTEFNACVYKSLTPTEFKGKWEQLVEKYDLEGNAWLNDMYAIRTQWIGAYTKQHFSAGITTTSRSESTNSFFDEYVQSSTSLKEFIENSQKALETQYLKEVKADYDSEQLERRLVLHSSLEMHASEIYTKKMFKRFQKELMKSTCYIVNSVKNNGTYISKLYLVEKATLPENCRRKYRVTVLMYEKIECSCKKFEHSGMICKLIIRYLDKKQKIKIPESLIMGRWTMNGNKIAGPLPYAPPGIGNDGASQPLRYGALCKSFQDLAASGSCSVSQYKYLMGVIDREKRYLKDAFADEERRERTHEAKTQEDYQHDPIFDPSTSKTKGRKKIKRYKSGIKMATSKIKIKPRKCNYCGAIGGEHDARNCPLREEHDRRNF